MSLPVGACRVGSPVSSLPPLPAGHHSAPTPLLVAAGSDVQHMPSVLRFFIHHSLGWSFLLSPLFFTAGSFPFASFPEDFLEHEAFVWSSPLKNKSFWKSSRWRKAEGLSWDTCHPGNCVLWPWCKGLLCQCCLLPSKGIDALLTPSSTVKAQGHWN